MKRILAIILAAATVFGCLGMSVCAADPVVSPSGFYVGRVLNVGETFTSVFNADKCMVTYMINADEVANVTSKLGSEYADELELTQFQDDLASFSGSTYTVKGYGDEVMSMMDNKGEFVDATAFGSSEDGEDQEEAFAITIDYKYTETTLFDYMSISGWTITKVTEDDEMAVKLELEAVWSTREPTQFEAFGETLYAKYLVFRNKMLDIFGNYLLQALPKFLATWAQFLKDITKV